MGFFNFLKKRDESNKNHSVSEDLKAEIEDAIADQIRFGFYDEKEIFDVILDMFYEEEINELWLKQLISVSYQAYRKEAENWQKPTDFDKLAKIFDELNESRIIALHRAGYTKQDGYSDVSEVNGILKKRNIESVGYCFYHTQDLMRAISEGNLFLAFDDITQDDTKAIELGKLIVKKLNENGFSTEWNETVEQRIEIKNISWEKIPDDEDWGLGRAIKLLNNN